MQDYSYNVVVQNRIKNAILSAKSGLTTKGVGNNSINTSKLSSFFRTSHIYKETNPANLISNLANSISNPHYLISNPANLINNPHYLISNPANSISKHIYKETNPANLISNPVNSIGNPHYLISNLANSISNHIY